MLRIRCRLLLPALLAVLVALLLTFWLLWPRPSAITPENALSLRSGMTLAEVEAILGGPARDETGGQGVVVHHAKWIFTPSAALRGQWVSEECAVEVDFVEGRVTYIQIGTVVMPGESPLDKLRRWFGL
jgi:hypothetical protein